MEQSMILIHPDIQNHPSLYQALLANKDAIDLLEKDAIALDAKIEESERKMSLAKQLHLPDKGMKNQHTRLKRQRDVIPKQIKAYRSGYLEIPRLQQRPQEVEFNNSKYWGFRFDKNTPLRILEVVKRAKEEKLFDKLIVFTEPKTDPILAGMIGKRYFYLASWR